MCWLAQRRVIKEGVDGETEGLGMKERGKQVSYALMIQRVLPHCDEYLTGR